jgi:hypothetical protein
MATRPVTINVFRPGGGEPWVGGVVEFTLVKGGYSPLAHYPKEAISATVPPSGLVEVDLWVNEESQIPTQWRARLPSGETAVFSVPPGTTPIAVEILRAIGDTPTTQIPSVTAQLEALIQIHNADPIAHPGLGGGGPGGAGVPLPTLPAATALSALRIVSGDGTNYAYSNPADPDSVWSIAGLTPNAVSQGQPITPIRNQPISDSAWNWDTSKPIVLGPNGTLMQSDSADWGVQVATPLSPQTIFIQIERPIEL